MTLPEADNFPLPPESLLQDELIELRLLYVLGPHNPEGRPPEELFMTRALDYRFAIHRRSGGLKVGRIHIRSTDDREIIESVGHSGYAVGEAHRRQGYASRVLRLIVGLTRHWGVSPLWVLIEPDNVASRRTAERAGLTLVDTVVTEPMAIALGVGPEVCRYRIEA